MTTTYTFDVSSTLDGFGAHDGDWGRYWGKQGPELLDHRLELYPTTIMSNTLTEPLDWPDASVMGGDAIEVVAALKNTSEVPLRSHGSLSLRVCTR